MFGRIFLVMLGVLLPLCSAAAISLNSSNVTVKASDSAKADSKFLPVIIASVLTFNRNSTTTPRPLLNGTLANATVANATAATKVRNVNGSLDGHSLANTTQSIKPSSLRSNTSRLLELIRSNALNKTASTKAVAAANASSQHGDVHLKNSTGGSSVNASLMAERSLTNLTSEASSLIFKLANATTNATKNAVTFIKNVVSGNDTDDHLEQRLVRGVNVTDLKTNSSANAVNGTKKVVVPAAKLNSSSSNVTVEAKASKSNSSLPTNSSKPVGVVVKETGSNVSISSSEVKPPKLNRTRRQEPVHDEMARIFYGAAPHRPHPSVYASTSTAYPSYSYPAYTAAVPSYPPAYASPPSYAAAYTAPSYGASPASYAPAYVQSSSESYYTAPAPIYSGGSYGASQQSTYYSAAQQPAYAGPSAFAPAGSYGQSSDRPPYTNSPWL